MDRINHIDKLSIEAKTLYLSTVICQYLTCLEQPIKEQFENFGDKTNNKRVNDLFIIKDRLVDLIKQNI